jgi:EAL domain-containing protein (putative c-di-GMP-specific phosphodiesterase class I)
MASVARMTGKWWQQEFEEPTQKQLGALAPAAHFSAGKNAERSLCRALRQAFQENAFCLFYQPILDLRTDRTIGAETLLRWRKGSEIICAVEFIETLEKSDLLDTVADWTLREACRNAAWIHRTLKPDFRVAVNVAPQQCAGERLLESVNGALKESGCNPRMLDLEITERACLSDCGSVRAAIKRFRDEGITVTIDDFGAGHANFTCLSRFPITHLKIDKYYCRHSKAQSKVLGPIIAAAHRAGITCTAEGVETAAQLRQLKLSGCDEAQGFKIARPMDLESLVNFLKGQPLSDAWRYRHAS